MSAETQVYNFLEPIVTCSELEVLEHMLATLNQGKPVALYWGGWYFLLPEKVAGYPSSRRVIDLPLSSAPTVPPDVSAHEALTELLRQGVPYALVLDEKQLMGMVSAKRLLEHIDSTERRRAAQLAQANAALRAEIARRTRVEEQLTASLQEKEVLLREIHHRVKNNLQIISSLLDLQSSYSRDLQTVDLFKTSQQRVRSMALIHERLYQSGNLARVDMLAYIQDLAVELFQVYGVDAGRISLNITVEQMWLNIDQAIPCALILQELISNCLKHAFPLDTPGEIHIELRSDSLQQSSLIVRDTGIGLAQAVDFRDTRSLGLQLVNLLTQQLHGTISLDRREGTTFTITFAELPSRTRVPATGS